MGEAINFVNNFNVEKVILNCGSYNDLEKDLIKVLDKKEIEYYSCIKELNIDNNKLYFLNTKEYDNENDNSNVIYTELYGYKFMFMGDAGVEKEKDILNKYNLSNIDVLKVGHHGSKTSSSKSFINETNPKYSIISVGKNNRYGHPNKEVLNTLKYSKIYRTDQVGSIMFKIKNNNKYDIFSEKVLQKLILEDIENFLEELGIGFTFIKSEYKIKINGRYNYIDLLLYNIKYKCYVVIELKVTELKKEHTGQIMTYMNYIDKNVKTIEENSTVGIIICKQDNEYIIKYCSDDRIIARKYELI